MGKKRILVVDDEVSITRLLKLNLERTGEYEVREENSGEMAVPAAREFRPDLIFLDVMMPKISGGEVAAQLRLEPDFRKTPIVFLTAAVKKDELGGSTGRIGGRYYIAKPMSTAEVVAVIQQMLNPPKPPRH